MLKQKRVMMICSLFCVFTLLGSIVGMALTGAVKAGSSDIVDDTIGAGLDAEAAETLQQVPSNPDDLGASYVLTTEGEPTEPPALEPATQEPAINTLIENGEEEDPGDGQIDPLPPEPLPVEEALEMQPNAVIDIYKKDTIQMNITSVGGSIVDTGKNVTFAITFTLSQLEATDILENVQARVELSGDARFVSATTYSFAGLTPEQQPKVYGALIDGKNYVVFDLPYIAKVGDLAGGTIELRATINPYKNGLTDNGIKMPLQAKLFHRENNVYVNVNQDSNTLELTSASALNWNTVTSSFSGTASFTFPETQNGTWTLPGTAALLPAFTLTTRPNYTDATSGVIYAKTLTMEGTFTLPLGVTIPINSSPANNFNGYLSFTGAAPGSVVYGTVSTSDLRQTVTLRWVVENDTLSTGAPAELGNFSSAVSIVKLDVDAAAFAAAYSGNTATVTFNGGSADINKSKVTGVVGGDKALGTAAQRSFTLNREITVPAEDPNLLESLKIAKKLLTPNANPLGYGDEAEFEISGFGNKTADKTLANYVLTDTSAINSSNLVPKSLTTGVYTKSDADYTTSDTYTIYFGGSNTSRTVNFKTNETVTVPAGTTSIEWRFGNVPVGFKPVTNPTVTMTGYPSRAVSTPQTFYNDAYVKFTYDGKNYTGTGRPVGDYYARAQANYQVQDTPIIGKNKSGYNLTANAYPATNYPGDELQYTVYMANTGTSGPLVDPRVVDSLSKFIYTGLNYGGSETVTTGTATNYILQSVNWGVYTLNTDKSLPYAANSLNKTVLDPGKKVPAANMKLSLDKRQLTAQSSASAVSTLTTWFTGNLESGTVLAITYKVKLKDYAAMFSTYPTEVVNDFKVINTFKVYHYGSDPGGGTEPGTDPSPGYNDGSCEVPVSKPYPSVGITKTVTSTAPLGNYYAVGSTVQFTITVNNAANANIRPGSEPLYKGQFKVVDVLDKNMTFVSATYKKNTDAATAVTPTLAPNTNGNGTGMTFSLPGDYGPGDTGVIVVNATVNAFDIPGASAALTNTAALYMTRSGTPHGEVYYFVNAGTASNESNTSNVYNASTNFDADDTTVKRIYAAASVNVTPTTPLVSITKRLVGNYDGGGSAASSYKPGADVYFVIRVINESLTNSDVVLSRMVDMMPGGLDYVESKILTKPASQNPGAVTKAGDVETAAWSVSGTTLPKGRKLTLTFGSTTLKNTAGENTLELIVHAKVNEAFFDQYPAMDANSKTVYNFGAIFAPPSALSVKTGTAQLESTSHAYSGSVPGTNESSWGGTASDNRIFNYVSMSVVSDNVLPGVRKFAHNVDETGVWAASDASSLEPGQKMGWEMWFANNSSTVSMVNPTIIDVLPNGFTFDSSYAVKLEVYASSTNGLTAASAPTGTVVATYDIGAPTINGNKLTWDPASYAAKAGKDVVIARNQIGVLKIQSVISAQYYGEAKNVVYLIPKEEFFSNGIISGWGAWAAAADIAPYKRGVTNSKTVSVWGVLGAASNKKAAKGATTVDAGSLLSVEANDTVTYTLEISNNGEKQFRNFVIIDRLPTAGDRGVMLVDQARGSEWSATQPTNVRVTKISASGASTAVSGAVISYKNILASTGFAPGAAEWGYAYNAAGNGWTSAVAADSNVMRLAIAQTIAQNEKLRVTFDIKVPAGQNGIAYNSFAFNFNNSEDKNGTVWASDSTKPAEPPKVGVETFTPGVKKEIIDGEGKALTNPTYTYGDDITFRLSDVKNVKSSEAINFFVEDVINNGKGGLRLKQIFMPQFSGGSGINYSITATVNGGGTKAIASGQSAGTAHVFSEGDVTNALGLGSGEYITKLKFDFGTVPAQFGHGNEIKLVFEVVKTPEDAYPSGQGVNKADLNFDNKAQASGETTYLVVDLVANVVKQTAKNNTDAATPAVADSGSPSYYPERKMAGSGDKKVAKFFIGGVKNDSVDGATLILTDTLPVVKEGGNVAAALVPVSMKFPQITSAGNARATVRYTLTAGTVTTLRDNVDAGTLSNASIDFNIPAGQYVEKIEVQFSNTLKAFALDGNIALDCELRGNATKFDKVTVNGSVWLKAVNKVNLQVIYGTGKATSNSEDFACLGGADEPIALSKAVKDNITYEKEQLPVFQLGNVKNLLDYEAADFTLYDTPQKGLLVRSIVIPAYSSSVNYTVYYATGDVPLDPTLRYNWLTAPGTWQQVPTGGTGATSASKTVDMPAGVSVTAVKVEFGTVPYGFAPAANATVDVTCFISAPVVNYYTPKGNNLYEAKNEATLEYTGVDKRKADASATITIEEVTWGPEKPKVTKDTDNDLINPNKKAVQGGIARFYIGSVENYVPNQAAELFIVDTPPSTGLRLERIMVPAISGASDVRYDIQYKTTSAGQWQAFTSAPSSLNVLASTGFDQTLATPVAVNQFRIVFKAASGADPEKNVPAGFKVGGDIVVDFRVDAAATGTKINKVELTNAYGVLSETVSDQDDVEIVALVSPDVGKTAVMKEVEAGKDAEFLISGIKNYNTLVRASEFTITDTPDANLYMKQVVIPAFTNLGTPAPTYNVTAYYNNGTSETLATNQAAGAARTVDIPSGKYSAAVHVTKLEIKFNGDVPGGFECAGNITAKFATNSNIDVYAPGFIQNNTVTLSYKTQGVPQTKDASDTVKIYDSVDDILLTKDGPLSPVILGSDVTFTIDRVENPMKASAVDSFKLVDEPRNKLALKSISMPAFAPTGNSVKYNVFMTNKDGVRQQIVTNQDAAVARSNIAVSLAADDYATRIEIEFGTVPVGFKNSAPISMVFATSSSIADYDNGDTAINVATLSFEKGRTYSKTVSAKAVVTDFSVEFKKQTAQKNAGNSPATSTFGQASYYADRMMVADSEPFTARFLLSGVKNNAADGAAIVVSDKPVLVMEGGVPVAGLVPVSLEIPAFTGATTGTYEVRYTISGGGTYTAASGNVSALNAPTTASFANVSAGQYVEEVRITFTNVSKSFAQNGIFALNCKWQGERNKLPLSDDKAWSVARNDATMFLTIGNNTKKSDSADIATLPADGSEPISVSKKAADASRIYEANDEAAFEIRDVRNLLQTTAQNFMLFDVPQNGLYIKSVTVPKFNASRPYTVYTTTVAVPESGRDAWLASNGNWTTAAGTGNADTAKTFTFSGSITAVKIDFGSVPVGFAPIQTTSGTDDPVVVTCAVSAPVTKYTPSGMDKYTALNETTLKYRGASQLTATASASINIEDVGDYTPEVTKTTDASVNPEKKAVAGRIARFTLGKVANYVPNRPGSLSIIDTVPAAPSGMKLERIQVPAVSGAADVVYDIEYRTSVSGGWSPLTASSMGVNAAAGFDSGVSPGLDLALHSFRIVFKAASGADPLDNVPAGFAVGNIIVDFRVDSGADVGVRTNSVELTNAYRGVSRRATASDTVEIFVPADIDVNKSVTVPEVAAGDTAQFQISNIKNYGTVVATDFTVTDTPDAYLYLKSVTVPAFKGYTGAAPTYSVNVTYNDSSTATLGTGTSNAQKTFDVADANASEAKHVTKLEIKFNGSVPVGFEQDGALTTVFNTNADIAKYPAGKKQINKVELTYGSLYGDMKAEDEAEVTVFDGIDDDGIKLVKTAVTKNVVIGDEVTFTVDSVENPMTTTPVDDFTLIDEPKNGLELKSITMPAFAQGTGITYKVFISTNKTPAWAEIASQLATAGKIITMPSTLASGEIVTGVKWEFGKVPVGFKNNAAIEMVFKTSVAIGDYTSNKEAFNYAKLSFTKAGKSYGKEVHDFVTVTEIGENLTLSKQTAKAGTSDAAISTMVDTANGIKTYYDERKMDLNVTPYTTKFLIDGFENNDADGVTFVLTDKPDLKKVGSTVVAGLVPTGIQFPTFTNIGASTYKVEYKLADGTTGSAGAGGNLTNNLTVDLSGVPGYVEALVITISNTPKGFKQNASIQIDFKLMGDISQLTAYTNPHDGTQLWLTAKNDASLYMTLGNNVSKTVDDSDFATIPAEDSIKLDKTAPTGVTFEQNDTAVFQLREVRNQMLYEADNFTLYDIPQAGMYVTNVNLPAFVNAAGVKYTVYYTKAAVATVNSAWTMLRENLDATTPQNIAIGEDAVTGIKIIFGKVGVGFGPEKNNDGTDKPVEVSCLIAKPANTFSAPFDTNKYKATNSATLAYKGTKDNEATDQAEIVLELVEFENLIEVSKTTNEATNPKSDPNNASSKNMATRGGLAQFLIDKVANYVPGRPAGVAIEDTPDAGLLLERIEVPASNVPTVVFDVKVREKSADGWVDLAGYTNLSTDRTREVVLTEPKAYQFRIEFRDTDPKTPANTVPAGFKLGSAIKVDFRVADNAALGVKTNRVKLINTYLGKDGIAEDKDDVEIFAPDNIAVAKKAVQSEIAVGSVGEFNITGIKNYHTIPASNFTVIDLPSEGIFLTQVIMPKFTAPNSPAMPKYEVIATYGDGSTEKLADEFGAAEFDSSVGATVLVPKGKSVLTMHVKRLEIKFKGSVPVGFEQSAVISTKFATDSKVSTYSSAGSSFVQQNIVRLEYNNAWQPQAPYTASARDTIKLFDVPTDFTVTKTAQNPTVNAGSKVTFHLDKIANPMTTSEAEEFTLQDHVKSSPLALYLNTITMPSFDNAGNVKYHIYVKTNLDSGWRLFTNEEYSANTAYEISVDPSKFQSGEYVTDVEWRFGTVPVGFKNRAPVKMQFTTSKDSNNYDSNNSTENSVTLSFSKQGTTYTASDSARVRVVFETEKRLTKVSGNQTVVPGQDVTYTISGFGNTSTSPYYDYAIDDEPQAGIDFKQIELPAFSQGSGVKYDVLYRTNFNSNWRTIASGVDAAQSRTFSAPSLAVNERFTAIRVFFDSAPVGFGVGNEIRMTFYVSADTSLFTSSVINNQARYSYRYDTASDETPYGTPDIIEIPEDSVPYSPVTVKNPLAVTGENGIAPLYWILSLMMLLLGLCTVMASVIVNKVQARRQR